MAAGCISRCFLSLSLSSPPLYRDVVDALTDGEIAAICLAAVALAALAALAVYAIRRWRRRPAPPPTPPPRRSPRRSPRPFTLTRRPLNASRHSVTFSLPPPRTPPPRLRSITPPPILRSTSNTPPPILRSTSHNVLYNASYDPTSPPPPPPPRH